MLPQRFLDFILGAMRLLLRPLLGPYDALWRLDDKSFTCMNVYPFCQLRRRTVLVSAFHSSRNPHPLQMRLVRLQPFTGKFLKGKLRRVFLHYSQPSRKFQHVTCVLSWGRCVGICRVMELIGDANRAMGEGKSGPVETGLTGLAATALNCSLFHKHQKWSLQSLHTVSVCVELHVFCLSFLFTGSSSLIHM